MVQRSPGLRCLHSSDRQSHLFRRLPEQRRRSPSADDRQAWQTDNGRRPQDRNSDDGRSGQRRGPGRRARLPPQLSYGERALRPLSRGCRARPYHGKRNRPKKFSTLYVDRGRISRHILPLLGNKLVRDVTQTDVNRFIRDVAGGKTATIQKTERKRGKAIVEGGKGTAARTVGLLGGILSFAVSEGVIPTNPARGVKRPADNHRARRLAPEEYRRLGKALTDAKQEAETAQAIAGVWLLALTGCRSGEITNLKWAEIDEVGSCFRLQDSKEGASVRPIGRAVLDCLSTIEKKLSCPYVLAPMRSGEAFGGMPRAWKRIVQRAKLQGVTPHTLRHSFASVAGDLGFTESTIAAMLGHSAGSITSRYVHHLDTVLVAAADKVAKAIHEMMTDCE